MTLNQLKIFVAVAEIGNITRAAEILGMTQAAASAAILTLEDIYQVKLFRRVGRSVELSETGKLFLPKAQQVIFSSTSAARSLRKLSKIVKGRLKIISSNTIANYWLPKKLSCFSKKYPEVQLNVSMSNTRGVEEAITNGTAEIGFVEGEVSSEYLNILKIDSDQPVLVASESFWAKAGIADAKIDIEKLPWIIRERGSGTRELLEDLVYKHGLDWENLNIILELPSNESVKEAVQQSAGVTLVSKYVVEQSISSGLLKILPIELKKRAFSMVFHKHRRNSNAAEGFIDQISVRST